MENPEPRCLWVPCGLPGHLRSVLFAVLLASFAACGGQQASEGQKPAASATASETPAKVQNAGKEADLATVTLAPQAEARLGIRTAAVEWRKVGRTRSYEIGRASCREECRL